MERQNHRIKVELTLKSPILTNTSGAIDFGVDAAMRRDRQERPAFPGSLIKGNLRHAWMELNKITGIPSVEFIKKWLGAGSSDARETPETGKISFSEFWSDLKWPKGKHTEKLYRIAIDEITGAAATGALQVLDSPYNVGEEPVFTGHIDTFIESEEKTELERWIKKGLNFVPAIGALKTNGFGKILKADITSSLLSEQPRVFDQSLQSEIRLGLRIKPCRPFCFAKSRIGEGNHFETEHHIPGGAITAAIARRLGQAPGMWPMLVEYIDQLSFTHATPVKEGSNKRPVMLPLSLVEANGAFIDIAMENKADLINDEAPLFLIDWKGVQFKRVHAFLNQMPNQKRLAALPTHQEIRTAINPETGSAKENQLFSREEVIPDGFDWLANLSLSRIDEGERQKVIEQLHDLLQQPLTHLSKTKASANATLERCHTYTCAEEDIITDRVLIYLQSPARLLPTGFHCHGTNQGEQLKIAYNNAWKALSENSLSLSHLYAQQKLLGGGHWWKRFGQTSSDYHPELFTSEGSVFALKIEKREQALPLLEQWRLDGLPQLSDAPGGEHWKTNPWIAANGYGEIAINLRIPRLEKEGATHG